MHRAIGIGILLWAATGLTIVIYTLDDANPDARWIIATATAIGVAAAILAAGALFNGHPILAILLLGISLIVPTYAAWMLLLLPIVLMGAIAIMTKRDRNPAASTT